MKNRLLYINLIPAVCAPQLLFILLVSLKNNLTHFFKKKLKEIICNKNPGRKRGGLKNKFLIFKSNPTDTNALK